MTGLAMHEVDAGGGWSLLVRAGRTVCFTALGDGANLSLLVLAAGDAVDRMNIPDTLKAQMSARIHPPMVLMSDRGLALASITGSSVDWHDCITGHGLDRHAAATGRTSYQIDGNGWRRSARDLLVSELRKHGRGEAELHACINLFSKVAPRDDDRGTLAFVPAWSRTGDWLSLRSELDLLLVMAAVPHPMDPAWSPKPVRVEVDVAAPVMPDDASVTFRPESARALDQSRLLTA
jgi:uncharacterized protein YcgI (DUF1989 family)